MNYVQAVQILDERREGAQMPLSVVEKALELTGDLDPVYTYADAVKEIRDEIS